MKVILLYIVVGLLLAGCGENNRVVPAGTTDTIGKPGMRLSSISRDTIFAGNNDTTISLYHGEAYVQGEILANKHQPIYSLKVDKGQVLIATVRPLKKEGNVRLNQIQQPGGAFDGPFGDSLFYEVKKTGILRFIIGQNLMAGDPWNGAFIFRVTEKKDEKGKDAH